MSLHTLSLLQWLSPAFPTGAFACSGGLETAIADERIRTTADLQAWLRHLLCHGPLWSDAVLLAQGLKPGADHDALDTLARALCLSAERLEETLSLGTAFARTVSAATSRSLPPRTLPIAIAEAAAPLGLPAETVVAHSLHAALSNLVTIATRAVPLGQTEGQTLLTALHPLIPGTAARATGAGLSGLGTAAFAADLASLSHETLQPRLYRT
ncbi:urease accessory protein UreF [Falsigemmobacter faecalis]|uniref:Urease accessory protein UreF n=1 Tax=Falsigemmobacter faecalis TaxID=2488730 RepID=A0A3P3DMR3_9RHOB|nr:urease accessory UreF family protein [Falsigemmobacter faecalis]RRH75560.1 urease accessory protein UreF [Falsigemmobacter faecalis]